MPLWIQRVSKIAAIARFHVNANIESHPPFSSLAAAETLWFIKVVRTLCIHSRYRQSLDIFRSQYFRENLDPSIAFHVIHWLTNYFNNPVLAFKFFQFTRLNLNLIHSFPASNLLLRSLCETGLHDSAKLVFTYMKSDGFFPDISILDSLVASFANAGEVKMAKEILVSCDQFSKEKGEKTSLFVYNKFLSFLVRQRRIQEAVNFFRDHVLKLQSCHPDTCTFNIVIRGLLQVEDVNEAFALFESMHSFNCPPDQFTYNILINGLCRAGSMDRAQDLLRSLQAKDEFLSNVVTYTSIISGYSKSGDMEGAASFFDEMIKCRIRPNTITFNALIDGFGKTGDMVSALKAYDKMVVTGCTPDIVTFTSLIDGHCRAGDLYQGLKLLDEMNARKLSPNLYTFSVLIHAFCKVNRLNEARNLLRMLQKRDDIVPQPFIYNPVIDGFCKAGKLNEANVITAEMEAKGCCHDKMTFTILIHGHCMKGLMVEAISIFNKMLAVGCAPDEITINSLTSCLLKAGMVTEANRIRKNASSDLHLSSLPLEGTKPLPVSMDIPVAV